MDEFSLERMLDQIQHRKTKDYFSEVLSSYNNGNYRSSVVMLWSVAICDIVFKLQSLVDIYGDSAAQGILDELTAIQEEDYKSSAWELKLLDEVHQKTNLLDTAEYEDLRYLQRQRHLSAHPVLNSDRELHSPSKETVRSLLRSTLEGVLIKPPFYTQKILTELLEDIEEASEVLNTREKVKKYIESRYLNRMKPAVELNVFRTLWKFVFRLSNEKCEKNRVVNFHALCVISDRNKALVQQSLEGDQEYYANVSSSGMPIAYLVYYLSMNSGFYSFLNDDAKLKINHCIENDPIGITSGWFVKESLDEHLEDVRSWLTDTGGAELWPNQLDALKAISDSPEWEESFCKLMSEYYGASLSYDQADARFQEAIPKYISVFDKASLEYLVEQIENNSQCYARGQAREDYMLIKSRIDELYGSAFDYDPFPHFKRKVRA